MSSVIVRVSQTRAFIQIKRPKNLEDWLSSRQMKDRRCVVLCSPKDYAATEHAHLGRFNIALIELFCWYAKYIKTQSRALGNVKMA